MKRFPFLIVCCFLFSTAISGSAPRHVMGTDTSGRVLTKIEMANRAALIKTEMTMHEVERILQERPYTSFGGVQHRGCIYQKSGIFVWYTLSPGETDPYIVESFGKYNP
jgi:hypothetical protein